MAEENSSVSRVGEDSPSIPETKTYKRRWYILFLFSLLCISQGAIWNTWGPLDASMRLVYNWTPETIALLTNWGPIAFILSIFFFAWLIDVHGMRVSCLVTAVCIAAGAVMRCVSFKPSLFTWFVHIGQFLNGFGGPVAMTLPPVISAVWFPATQRTTATAIGCASCSFGVALSFIIGPAVVPSPDQNRTFSTNITDIDYVKHHIQILMYAEAAWSMLILLLFIVYFPAVPKMPPSLTASIPRLDFREGLVGLFRLKRFWLLGWAYGISTGMSAAWSSVIAVNLSRIQVSTVSQDQAAWIGFYAGLAGLLAGMVIGGFADLFSRHLKGFLIALFSVGFVSYLMFALLCINVIPFHIELIYLTNIVANVGINGAIPLLFEMVCENTYPIAEGVTNGMMTLLNNVVCLVFYLVMMAPIGTAWMNWSLVGCTAACLPVLFFYKDHYSRLDVDTLVIEVSAVNSDTAPLITDT